MYPFAQFANATLTLLRRVVDGVDEYGNDIHVTTEITVENCVAHPQTSTESGDGGQQVITGLWVYAPTEEPIRAADDVLLNGLPYEVAGEPGVWHTPIGDIAFQQVALRRVTG